MSIAAPRRVGIAGLLGLLAGAIVLMPAPGNPGALRLAGVGLLWWYAALVAPLAAVLLVIVVRRASPEAGTGAGGSAALAALAGLLLAPVFTVYPQMGVEMILLAFIVVILGGMGSMGGSVVAAFVIGLAQSLLTLWMNPQRVAIAIFAIMIVVLIVRPRGFFGREGVLE